MGGGTSKTKVPVQPAVQPAVQPVVQPAVPQAVAPPRKLTQDEDANNDGVLHANEADLDGTSLVELQRGIFGILQGAAYRTFRHAYAADFHTHKSCKTMPYTMANFTTFVRAVMEMFKEMGVLDAKHHGLLERLCACVEKEEARIRAQIATATADDDKAFDEKQAALITESVDLMDGDGKIFEVVETDTDKNTKEGIAAGEGFGVYDMTGDSLLYLKRSNRVLLDGGDEAVFGAYSNVSFWYEEFMPLLLQACSAGSEAYDLEEQQLAANDATGVDGWFSGKKERHFFDQYGQDVEEGWGKIPALRHKFSIKRAWRLAESYLYGSGKQRERSKESGATHRDTGDLTSYVAFLDIWLQKSYIEEKGMRLSFPYFIGETTWTLHHSVAEIACDSGNATMLPAFREYFKSFVTMYPCPYCRHHLNEYVIVGRERQHYPLEYLFLGWTPTKDNLNGIVTPKDKLDYIVDGKSLRLFVWKLHNAVNSSICRQEEWYNFEKSGLHTSRYWPNTDALIYRATVFKSNIDADRLSKYMAVLKVGMTLERFRPRVLKLDAATGVLDEGLAKEVKPLIDEIDRLMSSNDLLSHVYRFRAKPEEEADLEWAKKYGHLFRNEDFTMND